MYAQIIMKLRVHMFMLHVSMVQYGEIDRLIHIHRPEKGVTNFGMRDAVQDCPKAGPFRITTPDALKWITSLLFCLELVLGSVFCEQMLANCGVQYLQPSFQELSVIKMYLEFLQSWSIYPTQCCIIETCPYLTIFNHHSPPTVGRWGLSWWYGAVVGRFQYCPSSLSRRLFNDDRRWGMVPNAGSKRFGGEVEVCFTWKISRSI